MKMSSKRIEIFKKAQNSLKMPRILKKASYSQKSLAAIATMASPCEKVM
jgi:hypothetical protein